MTALLPAKVYTTHGLRKSIYKKTVATLSEFYVFGLKKRGAPVSGTPAICDYNQIVTLILSLNETSFQNSHVSCVPSTKNTLRECGCLAEFYHLLVPFRG